ncbi:hypothetical protein ACFSF3_09055 [Vibrio chagasii]
MQHADLHGSTKKMNTVLKTITSRLASVADLDMPLDLEYHGKTMILPRQALVGQNSRF